MRKYLYSSQENKLVLGGALLTVRDDIEELLGIGIMQFLKRG